MLNFGELTELQDVQETARFYMLGIVIINPDKCSKEKIKINVQTLEEKE